MGAPPSKDRSQVVSGALGTGPNRHDVERVVYRLGRVSGPYILRALHAAGALTADAATLAGPIWGMAEYPEGSGDMTRVSWLRVFALAGYTVDGVRAERPANAVRLYRGAPFSRRLRMAWTDDLATAERFARGKLRGREEGKVRTADVAPERLLAHMHEDGRGESEYVISTPGLRVVALGKMIEVLRSKPLSRGIGIMSDRAVQYMHATLRAALEQACREELISRNVAKLVQSNVGDAGQHEPCSVEESNRLLLQAQRHRLHALWVLLVMLGVRRGEALAVR